MENVTPPVAGRHVSAAKRQLHFVSWDAPRQVKLKLRVARQNDGCLSDTPNHVLKKNIGKKLLKKGIGKKFRKKSKIGAKKNRSHFSGSQIPEKVENRAEKEKVYTSRF